MSREICDNAKLITQNTLIVFIRGNFHPKSNLIQTTATLFIIKSEGDHNFVRVNNLE